MSHRDRTRSATADANTGDDANAKSLRRYLKHFRRQELLIEFKNLRNPNHSPTGLYVMPDHADFLIWHGIIFIHRGYYREGVFKFVLRIPENYPEQAPTVRFITEIYHPLVDADRFFSLEHQFPRWRAGKDYVVHVLHYLKNCFKEAVLMNLQEDLCPNKEAYRIFNTERPLFAKLAAQCAQLSSAEAVLYDNSEVMGWATRRTEDGGEIVAGEGSIQINQLTDEQYEELRKELLQQHEGGARSAASGPNAAKVLQNFRKVTRNMAQML